VAQYLLIQQLQTDYSLTVLCDVLGIRRSSYYAWWNRPGKGEQVPLQVQAHAVHRRSRGQWPRPWE